MGFLAGLIMLFVLYLVGLLAWRILYFSRADADITLLSTPEVPSNAFEDKVVWITGASQGIGQELAQRFAALGARLILSSRHKERLEAVKATCSGKHAPAAIVTLPFDLTGGPSALREAVGQAMCAFGALVPPEEDEDGTGVDLDTPAGVDVVVLNAAAPRPHMFNVNVLGTIELAKQLAPCLVAHGGGHFVVVSSAAGKMPAPTQAVYAATKHAVNGFFSSMRSEMATHGIQVSVVCPGPIATDDPSPAQGASSGAAANSSSSDAPGVAGGGAAAGGEKKEDRMSVARCAELVVRAAAHQLPEAWISKQPVLTAFYAFQYLPVLATHLFNKVGASRVTALRTGSQDLYSANLLFNKED